MEPVVDIFVPPRGWPEDMGSRHFHPVVEGVEYSDAVHGCSEASFTVLDPITVAALTEDCPVWISDPRSGEVVWTGNVARNGLQRTTFGQSAVVRCTGNVDDFYSTYWSLPYKVLGDYGEWERETISHKSHRNWSTETGARPASPPWDAVVLSIDEGDNIYPGWGGRMAYMGHLASDMYIGGISFNADCGTATHPGVPNTTPSYLRWQLEVGNVGFGHVPARYAWQTSAMDINERASSTDFPAPPEPNFLPPRDEGLNYLVLATEYLSEKVEVANENVWFAASRMCIIGQRVNKWGANSYPVLGDDPRMALTQIDAGMVVEDLVGRCMRGVVDPARTTVNHTSGWNLIDSFNYRSPTSPGEILEDLMKFHPDHLWRVGLRSPTSGLAPMEWRPWDTQARYVVDGDRVEIDLDGAPDPLYNRVTITWTDWKGRPRSHSFEADPANFPDIASLDGWHEPEPLDLAESLGRMANVKRIGAKWLDQVAWRYPAGTITVTGPILDVQTQEMVPPSMLQSGTTLVITSDEPPYVHRVTETSHPSVDEAQLTVGRPRLDMDFIVKHRGHGRK